MDMDDDRRGMIACTLVSIEGRRPLAFSWRVHEVDRRRGAGITIGDRFAQRVPDAQA